ncbi:MAG: L-threonylcarbamoyladenylate synthase [Candidatus Azotimanducaceae bacterium]|uniref:Threonylcarbamoyl-AMP synthase n=1 Tax=OM182 bacterium TaxID=2510334 RepID=A0A520S5J4_9GAMM|nr:tRNA threonylcarbamoyladenosine biosynthesis protein RimN [Gammaproteobacteria bacterium]OUV68390.1 MAG: hypothetical protein CBC93_01515 [Gammaproteobacteria bacterium TMED133]RZO77747.1 MAG: tRNA threonylcarbamoyladenosine biosynthesis protein RimN [OM182 bacterium]
MQLPLWRIDRIIHGLTNGEVIAYPTEGVWGLGCLPELHASVAHILTLKRRSWKAGLILVASQISHVDEYLDGITNEQRRLLESVWPAPVTFLVPDNGFVPCWIKGRNKSVALRVSAHPVVQGICQALGGPIVSTSANPTGRKPATSALKVRQYFGNEVDLLVPGNLSGQEGPSEIRDLDTDEIIRSRRVI